MKCIIAGSRDFNDYDLMKAEVNLLIAPGVFDRQVEIISGGAKGADLLGEKYANEYGIPIKKFYISSSDWVKHGKKAAYLRNCAMAEYATHCICFWDGKSSGTKMMIKIANEMKLILNVINLNQK